MPHYDADVKSIVWFPVMATSGPRFCEKHVNNSQENPREKIKCWKLSALRAKVRATK